MISSEQTGYIAGSAAKQAGEQGDPGVLALRSYALRVSAGIAHTEPQEGYVRGFCQGFTSPVFIPPDGLCQAEALARGNLPPSRDLFSLTREDIRVLLVKACRVEREDLSAWSRQVNAILVRLEQAINGNTLVPTEGSVAERIVALDQCFVKWIHSLPQEVGESIIVQIDRLING